MSEYWPEGDDLGDPWVRIRPPDRRFRAYFITAGSNSGTSYNCGWFRWTRKSAERKARRLLVQMKRENGRRTQPGRSDD